MTCQSNLQNLIDHYNPRNPRVKKDYQNEYLKRSARALPLVEPARGERGRQER